MNAKWRDKKTWNSLGLVLTVAWFTYFAMATGGDTNHPLFDFVFLVPLCLWLGIALVSRLFGAGEPDRGPDG